MKPRILALAFLLALLSPLAFAANPALGIYNTSGYLGTQTYTSASGYTSQSTGSSFVVLISCSDCDVTYPTVSDTVNGSSTGNTYSVIPLTSGTNPIEDSNDVVYLFAFVCQDCAGGVNHEIAVSTVGTLEVVTFVEVENTTAVDVSASAYAVASTVNVNVTPTVSGDLILAAAMTGGGSYTISPGSSSGFTALAHTAGTKSQGSAYLVGAGTSTYNAAMTLTGTQGFAGITIAFKGSGSPPANHANQILMSSALAGPHDEMLRRALECDHT